MDKYYKPVRLDTDPNSPSAAKEYKHWLKTFENFITSLPAPNKLNLLINHVDSSVYEFITDCVEYNAAKETLKNLYIKPRNEIFARHLLASSKQQPGESLDQYLVELKLLARECNFVAVTAEQCKSNHIRDSFINGLSSTNIRQRLLENTTLTLDHAFTQARSLDVAQQSFSVYHHQVSQEISAAVHTEPNSEIITNTTAAVSKPLKQSPCWNCGNSRHPRSQCPARDVKCHNCQRKGHYKKHCRSAPDVTTNPSAAIPNYFAENSPTLATVTAAGISSPFRVCTAVIINNKYCAEALLDSGSTNHSFIDHDLAKSLRLKIIPCIGEVGVASSSLSVKQIGYCLVTLGSQ